MGSVWHTPRGYSAIGGRCDLKARGRLLERLPHGVGGLVGTRPRLPDLRDRAGLGPAAADRVVAVGGGGSLGWLGHGPGRRFLLLLLRRHRDRQVALPEGRLRRLRSAVPV